LVLSSAALMGETSLFKIPVDEESEFLGLEGLR
jgi:hypothetical protein